MARSGVEVIAQGEASTFLNLIGWSEKSETEARCTRCHQVLYPKHTGKTDFTGGVRGAGPIAVEVKATADKRWAFSTWGPGQRAWAEAWNARMCDYPATYLWLQIGPKRVDSTEVNLRRSVWLVPQALVVAAEISLAYTGVKSIPMNAAAMSKGTDDFLLALTATNLFNGYQMTWIDSKVGWWPSAFSRLWENLRIEYHEPNYFSTFNAEHPHPDSVGTREVEGTSGAGVRQPAE